MTQKYYLSFRFLNIAHTFFNHVATKVALINSLWQTVSKNNVQPLNIPQICGL